MRQLYTILFAGVLFSSTAEGANQDARCDDETSQTAASISDLPMEVQTKLGRFIKGTSGLADAGEEFNSSDVITDAAIPRSRFISARIGRTCIRVQLERGGRA